MSRNIVAQILSLLLGAALMGSAVAQQDSKKDQSSKQDQQKSESSQGQSQSSSGATRDAPVAGTMPLGVSVEETAVVLKGWRASKLVGASVYNDANERIGKIEDMIVSPDGKLSVAIVDVGGFLGVGKHRVAIPVDQFSDITAKRLVLPKATKEALKALPEFQYA